MAKSIKTARTATPKKSDAEAMPQGGPEQMPAEFFKLGTVNVQPATE